MQAHGSNPSSQKAEAARKLELHVSLVYRERTLSQKQTNKQTNKQKTNVELQASLVYRERTLSRNQNTTETQN